MASIARRSNFGECSRTYKENDTFDWGNDGTIDAQKGVFSNGSKFKQETAGDALAGISGTYQILHATEVARWNKYGVQNDAAVLANILKCVPLLPGTMVILESTAEGAQGEFYNRWLSAVDADDFLSGKVIPTPGQFIRVFAPWFEFADSSLPSPMSQQQKDQIRDTLDQDEMFAGEKDLIEAYGRDDNKTPRLGTSVTNVDQWEQLAWRRWAIIEECKKDKAIFDQDYPHSWQDAFIKSGNMRFNSTGVKMMRKRMSQRTPEYGILEDNKGRVVFRKTEKNEAKVIIFERPTAGRRYLEAIDPMTGKSQVVGDDPDLHGVHVLRAGFYDERGKWTRPAQAARIVPCRWDIDVLEEQAWRLAKFYGGNSGCKIVVEMNMDRGITELLKLRCADLYQREVFDQREQKTELALGFHTNEKTRETLIDNMAGEIRRVKHDRQGNRYLRRRFHQPIREFHP